ncbi:cytidine deaminase-like protein [Lasiosphaeria miniovina]|uniref:Cytidine deaminase-like protein n=1 Tax=Lasiosphaeria miniovina TaxID=1954250 RepID=A0AA40A0J4_9PEZI|nr:cytidine deaminase-like protein [Lasiosphaeria miniovina]KAK0706824.1 cytidine deaminase-like protein [Lasiosphaeria miniovina]
MPRNAQACACPQLISLHASIVKEFVQGEVDQGILIPLKTASELGDNFTTDNFLITRAPVKAANLAISKLRELLHDDVVKGYPHLRRCAKPCDLPAHLKCKYMNDTPEGRHIHTGKSTWIYIICGPESELDRGALEAKLRELEEFEVGVFIASIVVPLVAPNSQMQAAMWSQHFWPTVYRKNNPIGPHPAMLARSTEEIDGDTSVWMMMAQQVAIESHDAGYGEPVGACIIKRDDEGHPVVVALAADARWIGHDRGAGETGNVMAHAVMRLVSMVAQKLKRVENKENGTVPEAPEELLFDAFQDAPILEAEQKIFQLDHPCPNGYLSHGLELYVTHEPCVMCCMAILHSRMGKVVFRYRQPLTGGLCAEHRGDGHPALAGADGGQGLGLFWRRELNWSLIAWEWESPITFKMLDVDAAIHI